MVLDLEVRISLVAYINRATGAPHIWFCSSYNDVMRDRNKKGTTEKKRNKRIYLQNGLDSGTAGEDIGSL